MRQNKVEKEDCTEDGQLEPVFCLGFSNGYMIRDHDGSDVTIERSAGGKIINQGLSELTSHIEQAIYKDQVVALKFLRPTAYYSDEYLQHRSMLRASVCNHLLGRLAFSFRYNESQCLVTNWLHATNLNEITDTDLQAVSITDRIKMAYDLTKQLHVLHQAGIIHHDVKISNVMVSLAEKKIYLTDFDGANLPNESPRAPMPIWFSKRFVDITTLSTDLVNNDNLKNCFNYQSDIYGLAFVFAKLFPELFGIEMKNIRFWQQQKIHTFSMALVKPKSVPSHDILNLELLKIVKKMYVQNRSDRYNHTTEIVTELSAMCGKHNIQLTDELLNQKSPRYRESFGKSAFSSIDKICARLENQVPLAAPSVA